VGHPTTGNGDPGHRGTRKVWIANYLSLSADAQSRLRLQSVNYIFKSVRNEARMPRIVILNSPTSNVPVPCYLSETHGARTIDWPAIYTPAGYLSKIKANQEFNNNQPKNRLAIKKKKHKKKN